MSDQPNPDADPTSLSESTARHRAASAGQAVRCAVLTISDSRTTRTDRGGPMVRTLLEQSGHEIVEHDLCRDEPDQIAHVLDQWIADDRIQVILTTGGTGIAARDSTIEIVSARLTARLDGFGELFRMLSFEQVGPAAMLSRACAGLVASSPDDQGTFIFAMPGSPNAIEVAMTRLIVPELAHIVWERKR